MEADIRSKVFEFIVANFLFGDAGKMPADEASLIENGVVDSTGILELIEFLESSFGIEVKEVETVPNNLDGVANLTRYVKEKLAAGGGRVA
jgi:acyl carrier protein